MPKQHQNEIAENAEIEQRSDGVLVVSNHRRHCNAELFLPFQRHQPAAVETAAILLSKRRREGGEEEEEGTLRQRPCRAGRLIAAGWPTDRAVRPKIQ